jgi:hypothetical protein
MDAEDRFSRFAYASVSAVIGAGLFFIFWAEASAGLANAFSGVFTGALGGAAVVSAILGWFFGEKFVAWLSEAGPPWP